MYTSILTSLFHISHLYTHHLSHSVAYAPSCTSQYQLHITTTHTHPNMDLIPAKLRYLCIYNPTLGTTQQDLHKQIVYFHSDDGPKSENEKLREIGLAQGMVEFSKELSGGEMLTHVTSTKTRTVVVNLENDIWAALCVHLPVEVRNGVVVEYNMKGLSGVDVIIGELKGVWQRWRLFGGDDESRDKELSELTKQKPKSGLRNEVEIEDGDTSREEESHDTNDKSRDTESRDTDTESRDDRATLSGEPEEAQEDNAEGQSTSRDTDVAESANASGDAAESSNKSRDPTEESDEESPFAKSKPRANGGSQSRALESRDTTASPSSRDKNNEASTSRHYSENAKTSSTELSTSSTPLKSHDHQSRDSYSPDPNDSRDTNPDPSSSRDTPENGKTDLSTSQSSLKSHDSLRSSRDLRDSFFNAFSSCWNPNLHSRGILNAIPYTETDRIHLSEDTVQVVEAVLSRDPNLVHCSIARSESRDSKTHSKIVYSSSSCFPLSSWLLECCDIGDEMAFGEESGFVSHVSIRKSRARMADVSENTSPSPTYISKLGTLTSSTVSTLTSWNPWKQTFPNSEETIAAEDHVEDGKFVVRARVTCTQEYGKAYLVVYQRAPLTFALLYRDVANLVYPNLHLKMASLVEPVVRDIERGLGNVHYPKLLASPDPFFYIVVDPKRKTLTTNLRHVPYDGEVVNFVNPNPEPLNQEIAHVHTQFGRLMSQQESFLGHEKLARSNHNWWFYWTRLPDSRQVYMARKWLKSKPSADGHSVVNAMGKSAKLWLDGYVKTGLT